MKAALACAVAYRPRLILLDEPLSGLDALARDEFIQALLGRAAGATILISSHDLAEVETFVSHVGYLDRGRIEFSQELATLSERFREIEVTLAAPPLPPPTWPAGWLNPQTFSAMIRFVDSQFDEHRTRQTIERLFPAARSISATPMPLREIFVALAGAKREAA